MSKSKRERFEAEKERLEPSENVSEADKEAISVFLSAKDPEDLDVSHSDTKADGTLSRYAYGLRRVATLADFDLSATTATEINEFFSSMLDGDVDGVKDEGLSKGTVKGYQSVLRKFNEYHDFGIEKDEISMFKNTDTAVDERDLFGKPEIEAIREAASHPRDAALVDLLLYTGQRLSAILNLRRKDINVEDGTLHLNMEDGDLKGAKGKRPLLYAEKSVRDWYNSHPCDDREAYFITHKYGWEEKDYEAGERLDPSSVYRQLQRIGEAAGVEKPMNAHNFRHTFVTVCKRDYGMDNDTIKRLIGHRPDSNIMEKTYAHLTDQDVINAAERATGIQEEEPESTFTPNICDVCGEPVNNPKAKACANCGALFTPDAQAAKEKIEEDVYEDKGEAEGEEEEAVDKLRNLINENPELIEELTDN